MCSLVSGTAAIAYQLQIRDDRPAIRAIARWFQAAFASHISHLKLGRNAVLGGKCFTITEFSENRGEFPRANLSIEFRLCHLSSTLTHCDKFRRIAETPTNGIGQLRRRIGVDAEPAPEPFGDGGRVAFGINRRDVGAGDRKDAIQLAWNNKPRHSFLECDEMDIGCTERFGQAILGLVREESDVGESFGGHSIF